MVGDIIRKNGYLALGTRMKRVGERLQAEVQYLMKAQNISILASQYPLLACLDEYGPLTIGDIATALGVKQPGVTRSVGQLVKQGHVTIQRSKQDQRTKIVALTNLGRTVVEEGKEKLWPQIEYCLTDILSGHSGTLLEQLDILEDALEENSFSQRISKVNWSNNNG